MKGNLFRLLFTFVFSVMCVSMAIGQTVIRYTSNVYYNLDINDNGEASFSDSVVTMDTLYVIEYEKVMYVYYDNMIYKIDKVTANNGVMYFDHYEKKGDRVKIRFSISMIFYEVYSESKGKGDDAHFEKCSVHKLYDAKWINGSDAVELLKKLQSTVKRKNRIDV